MDLRLTFLSLLLSFRSALLDRAFRARDEDDSSSPNAANFLALPSPNFNEDSKEFRRFSVLPRRVAVAVTVENSLMSF